MSALTKRRMVAALAAVLVSVLAVWAIVLLPGDGESNLPSATSSASNGDDSGDTLADQTVDSEADTSDSADDSANDLASAGGGPKEYVSLDLYGTPVGTRVNPSTGTGGGTNPGSGGASSGDGGKLPDPKPSPDPGPGPYPKPDPDPDPDPEPIPLPDDVHDADEKVGTPGGEAAVSGSRVVWSVHTGESYDLFLYDGVTGEISAIAVTPFDELQPDIDGDTVVFARTESTGATNIHAINIETGVEAALTSDVGRSQTRPKISGTRVVWEDFGSGFFKPYVYSADLSDGVATRLTTLSAKSPDIAGDIAVFEAYTRGWNGDSDIYAYDFSAASPNAYPVAAVPYVDELLPATDGSWVAWVAPAGESTDVWASMPDGTSSKVVLSGAGEQTFPTVGGGIVYSIDNDGTNVGIRASDASSTVQFELPYPPQGSVIRVSAQGAEYAWLENKDGVYRVFAKLDVDRVDAGTSASWSPAAWQDTESVYEDTGAQVAVASALGLIDEKLALTGVYAAAVRAPYGATASVEGTDSVKVVWRAVSGATAYDVYRHSEAITSGNIGSAEKVAADVTALNVTVAAKSDERAKKFTYYYAVVAKSGTEESVPSVSSLPDPHRSLLSADGMSSSDCMRCHSVHGTVTNPNDKLGAKGALSCYRCHGSTDSSKVYGSASSLNIQREFYDYSDQTPGSQHRSTEMTQTLQECDACHYVHNKPYRSAPTTTSYGKLLRKPSFSSDTTAAAITDEMLSTDAAPFDEAFCYGCHGPTQTYMNNAGVGYPDAWQANAGDHNKSGFDTVAHMPTNLPDELVTLPNGGTDPQNTCMVCHNKHGSSGRGLVDYRETSLPLDKDFDQAELCFSCHENYANEVASYGSASSATYFAWNGRNVRTEFGKASSHPYSTTVVSAVAQGGSWTQSTESEFGNSTLSSLVTTPYAGGAVELEPASGSGYLGLGNIVSPNIIVSGTHKGWKELIVNANVPTDTTMTVDVIDPGTGNPVGGIGSGYDDILMSTGENTINLALPAGIDHNSIASLKLRADLYGDITPPPAARVVSDDFSDNSFDTTLWTDVPTMGGATDPDAGSTQTVLDEGFETAGYTANFPTSSGQWARSTNWDPEGTWDIRGGNASTNPDLLTSLVMDLAGKSNVIVEFDCATGIGTGNLDAGEYLRVEYTTNGSAWVDGYSLQGTGGTNTRANQTFSIPSPTATTQIRLRVEGADSGEYAYWDGIRVYADSVPTTLWPDESNQEFTLRAEGAGFAGISDEGDFIYTSSVDTTWYAGTQGWEAVIRVDSATWQAADGKAGLMVRTGTSTSTAGAAGADMVGLYVTRDNGVTFQYRNGGTTQTDATTASLSEPIWLKLVYDGSDTFTAWHSADGSTWTQVGGSRDVTMNSAVLVGLGLTSTSNGNFAEATFDDFSVTETVIVPNATMTPRLEDWTVTYDYVPAPSSNNGEVTCYNCHNTHYVNEGGTGVWDMARVSDPDNTKLAYSGTVTNFCLKCHDGTTPSAQVSASQLVPYNVIMSTVSSATSPFFPGWDKNGYTSAGHGTSRVNNMTPGCETCHDPHGSDNERLTALTAFKVPSSPAGHINERRNNSSTYAEEELCLACHLSNRSLGGSNCTNGACHPDLDSQTDVAMNIETAFGYTYTHPITTSGIHEDTEDSSNLAYSASDNRRHSECVDCHDPHSTEPGTHVDDSSKAGAVLNGVTGVLPNPWPSDTVGTGASSYVPAFDKWSGIGAADYDTVLLDGDATDYEAYLCFKCHSSYTTQPSSVTRNSQTYTPTDVAREFNPANQSGHNVLGNTWPKSSFNIGGTTYTWTIWTGGFQTGYDTSEMITCSSCHEGQGAASGPHGSTQEYLIDSAYTTEWNSTGANLNSGTGLPSTLICAKCHNNIRNTNIVHSEHDTRGSQGGYCRFCHVGIPHGWKRPRLLGYTTDPDPYATWRSSNGQSASGNYGLIEFDLQSYTPNSWDKPDCYAGCSSSRHPNQSNPWP